MIYLASPYSHPDPLERQYRYERMIEVSAQFLNQGHYVYSPIVHCHPLALAHAMPTDFLFWQHYNRHMIECADELWVIQLDGWHKSEGVAEEIIIALKLGKTLVYIDLED